MSLAHAAAVVGFSELPAGRLSAPPPFPDSLEMCAFLAGRTMEDAGLPRDVIDGLIVGSIRETRYFMPSTVAEYLGLTLSYGDVVDLGGASAAGMIWRAAAAIHAGVARAVLCLAPGLLDRTPDAALANFGASSYVAGSPQAEFDIPNAHIGQNVYYALLAQRYGAVHGYDARSLARIVAQQRINANATPGAIFEHQPLTEDDVLASRMIAEPLRLLEIVMPVDGGNAVLVVARDLVRDTPHRPVWLSGAGEGVAAKSPQYMADMLKSPVIAAAGRAFAMAGIARSDIDAVQAYDCYSITVLLTLEHAGFVPEGAGMAWLRERNLTWQGDFPLNTNGGQLGYGQAGLAGGMTHVVEAVRQLMGRAGERQIRSCDAVYVNGNGGIMGENVALILQGA